MLMVMAIIKVGSKKMGNDKKGKKKGSRRTVVNKGPKLKPNFGGASNPAPGGSIPRDIPRPGRHIHVGGHPRYGYYKGG